VEIKEKYLGKYMHEIAIDQIADEYLQKGYEITKEENLGDFRADLIARKGDEQIVIEVKTGKLSSLRKQELAGLANYVRSKNGYKFLVAVATPPQNKKIDIEGLEQMITNYIHSDLPSELDELSTHTRLDEVTDVNIDKIQISENSFFIEGEGVISVELQFGSDVDQDNSNGFKSYDNFPFKFAMKLILDNNFQFEIEEVIDLK
jgi:Holliday junction resolvase